MNVLSPLVKTACRRLERLDNARLLQQSPAPGVEQVCNLPYGGDADPMHLLDVYYPAGTAEPLPLLVDIHGGALVYGTKDLNKIYATTLASYGFTVVSISYRLAPTVTFDAQVRDVLAAFHWIEENAGRYPYRTGQAYLTGDSAGALLSVYGNMVNGSVRLQRMFGARGSSLRFLALGLVSGLFYMREGGLAGLLRPVVFGSSGKSRAYLSAMDLKQLPAVAALPPICLITSEEDTLQKQTLAFDQQLTALDLPHTLINWPCGEGKKLEHVFSIAYPQWPESRTAIEKMTGFFLAHSAPEPIAAERTERL